MKLAILVVVLAVGCGSKAKPAPVEPAAKGSAAAECCCTGIPNSQNKMLAPDACTSGGGTCNATEDSCHGIEGPIP